MSYEHAHQLLHRSQINPRHHNHLSRLLLHRQGLGHLHHICRSVIKLLLMVSSGPVQTFPPFWFALQVTPTGFSLPNLTTYSLKLGELLSGMREILEFEPVCFPDVVCLLTSVPIWTMSTSGCDKPSTRTSQCMLKQGTKPDSTFHTQALSCPDLH